MKRLLVRISALVTIVALGLIAMAHAQRGVGDPAMAAPAVAPQGQTAVTPTGPALTDLAGQPQPFPAGVQMNPLRLETTPSAYAVRPISAAAAVAQAAPAADQAAAAPSVARSPASPASDPFSLRAATDTTAGSAPPASSLLPAAPLAATAAPPGAADSLTPIPAPDAPQAGSSQPPQGLAGDRYRTQPQSTEPAQIPSAASLNTNTLPSSIAPGSTTTPAAVAPAEPSPAVQAPAVQTPLPYAAAASPDLEPRTLAVDSGQAAPLGGSRAGEGTGRPGEKHLEGPQSPQITVEKLAPAEVQVGKAATFQIKVRNSGQISAHQVEVRDEVPRGARLLSTRPRASQGVRGELLWTLGTLNPGDDMTIDVELMPVAEGDIGSVATVHFQAQATARARATKPVLELTTTLPQQALIGEQLLLSITVANTGSGAATGVVLEERVPAGLQHPAGTELEYDVGQLKPGESRQLQLNLAAVQPGKITNLLIVRGDADLKVEDRKELEVIAPRLDIALQGSARRYLEREAVYVLSVSNPGTAPARQVQLVAQLPPGLQFVSANNAGFYDQTTRTVQWTLEELPVHESGTVQLTALPVEPGDQALKIRGSDASGVSVEKEHPVKIEGIAAINFEVVDAEDPIELNGQTTYEIKVVNQGSKAATDVQVTVLLPPEMRYVAAEGPTQHAADTSRVAFEPLARLAPKADTIYQVRVQGVQPGDTRLRVQITTDEIRTPVTKEESTRVYSD